MSDSLDRIVVTSKSINSSEYLYNSKACNFKNLTYQGALKEKIRLGKLLLKKLNEISFDLYGSKYTNNEVRLLKVSNAIDFNKNLLDEIKDCE